MLYRAVAGSGRVLGKLAKTGADITHAYDKVMPAVNIASYGTQTVGKALGAGHGLPHSRSVYNAALLHPIGRIGCELALQIRRTACGILHYLLHADTVCFYPCRRTIRNLST